MLRHIISKEGWSINPYQVSVIYKLTFPSNKKALESFLGQFNFARRFIQDFTGSIRPVIRMLNKETPFHYTLEIMEAFEKIKLEIMRELVLRNPNFSKHFIFYAYGVEKSIGTILNYKVDNNEECPIVFFSKTLHNYEKKYSFIKKHVCVIMEVLNKFKHFVSQSKVLVLIMHPNMRNYIL